MVSQWVAEFGVAARVWIRRRDGRTGGRIETRAMVSGGNMKALVRILVAAAFVCSFAGLALAANSRSLSPESQTRTINLESQQEVPAVSSTATGTATFTLDVGANTLTVSGTFSGLASGVGGGATAAHIH